MGADWTSLPTPSVRCRTEAENSCANYCRFRLQPKASGALAARVKRPGKEFVGCQRALYPGEDDAATMVDLRTPAG